MAMFGLDWTECLVNSQGQPDPNGVPTLDCIPIILKNLITAALVLAGVTAVVFIMIAGFKYIRSNGDPKQAESARKTLTYSIIGLVLILLSFFIVFMIGSLTGAECIKIIGFQNCK